MTLELLPSDCMILENLTLISDGSVPRFDRPLIPEDLKESMANSPVAKLLEKIVSGIFLLWQQVYCCGQKDLVKIYIRPKNREFFLLVFL